MTGAGEVAAVGRAAAPKTDRGGRVLVVDDDPAILQLVGHLLSEAGFACTTVATGQAGVREAAQDHFSAVVLDLDLPDLAGREVLKRLLASQPELPVVILTANRELDMAVECMQDGATDYVSKPCDPTRLVTAVRNASERGRLRARLQRLAATLHEGRGFESILGKSPAVRASVDLLARAAKTDVTVLLLGESGTGKEIAARAIHAESARRAAPFVTVNCGAIPTGLIESELFGHQRGAFTGAVGSRPGRFEQAEGGTIFLDEIGELQFDLQVKLLRVLQDRCVQRIGASRPRDVDVRVIAATNRDLRIEAEEGRFRQDLFYRLAVFPIELPPLRDREGDVLLLARVFLQRFAAKHERPAQALSEETAEALCRYGWPGNVRELENVIERAVILEDGETLSVSSLPARTRAAAGEEEDLAPTDTVADGRVREDETIRSLEEEERRLVLRALRITRWNMKEAARRLGIGRATIYRKVERYGLSPERDDAPRRAEPGP